MQKNKYQGTVGPSSHDHDQNFGIDDGVALKNVVLNSHRLGHPLCVRGVEEKVHVERSPLSHSKSLGRGKTFVVGPIDREILRKEVEINKLERTTFDQASMIKELEAELKVLQREAKEE